MLTAWKSLDSQGHIADLPCTCFRYSYSIAEFVPLLGVGFGSQTIYMRFAVHVEGPGGGILFRQTACTPITVVNVGVPGMQLYTWWAGETTLLTTVCGTALPSGLVAAPISAAQDELLQIAERTGGWPDEGFAVIGPADRGPFERVEFVREGDVLLLVRRGIYGGARSHAAGELVVLAAPTIGAEQGIMVAGGESGYTDLGIYLAADWLSPVYRLRLPAGSTFHIDFHNCGVHALRKSIAAIRTQVCVGGAQPWLYIPEHGMWLTAETEDGETRVQGACNPAALRVETSNTLFASRLGAMLIQGKLPQPIDNAVLVRSGPASMRLIAVGESEGALYATDNDIEGDLDRWQPLMKLGDGVTLLGVCTDGNGQLYCLVQNSGGEVQLLVHQFDYDTESRRIALARTETIQPCIRRVTENDTQLVPFAGLTAQLHELRWQKGRLDLVADVGGEQHLYTSSDGGRTWEE